MEARLAIEPSGAFFKVKRLDQADEPRLNWPAIYSERIFKCKNDEERHSAVNARDDYGPNANELLIKLALEDENPKMRPWAFCNLCRRNKGSDDLHFVELARTVLETNPVDSLTHQYVLNGLWDSAPSPELFQLLADELDENPITAPKPLAQMMTKHQSDNPQIFDRFADLCREEFGPGPEEWRDIDASLDGQGEALWQMLKQLLGGSSPLSLDIDFANYAVSLATGPIKELARGPYAEGPRDLSYYLEKLGAYLRTLEDQDLADELRLQLLNNREIADKDRTMVLTSHIGVHLGEGSSPEEIRASLSHLLTGRNPEMTEKADELLNRES